MKYTFTVYYREADFYEKPVNYWNDSPKEKIINAKTKEEAERKFIKRFPDKIVVYVD